MRFAPAPSSGPLGYLCIPCIIALIFCLKVQNPGGVDNSEREGWKKACERERREQRLKDIPLPLSEARKREISPHPPRSSAETAHPGQRPETCYLLSRLPPELRIMIWELVLGGQTFHITRFPKCKIGYVLCPGNVPHDWPLDSLAPRDRGSPYGWNPRTDWGSGTANSWHPLKHWGPRVDIRGHTLSAKWRHHNKFPTLLQTCRQIYAETIPVLYQLNVFSFASPAVLTYFTRSIPSSHRRMLRTLRLQHQLSWYNPFCLSYNPPSCNPSQRMSLERQEWEEACLTLSRELTSLQDLRVLIINCAPQQMDFYRYGYLHYTYILESLRQMKVVEGGKFVVDIPWRQGNAVERDRLNEGDGDQSFETVTEHGNWRGFVGMV